MVNPPYSISDDDDDDYPPKISPTRRVFNLNLCRNKPDPKVFLDEAWILLVPALTSILHEENLDRFCFAEISQAVDKTSCNPSSSEDLSNLIVDVCGTYISTTLQSLAVHCNDDDPSLLLLPLEKFWLEFPKKLRFICEIAGAGGPNLWELGLNLLPRKLFLASQICDKVRTFILLRVTDQRLGKPVNMSQLENLMYMFRWNPFRDSGFLKKPFLDSTAEFYAAEAKQVLEQSSDLPQYLKYVDQRVGEEKKKCINLPLFSCFQDELLEVVNRELLGVHARALLEKGFEKLMDERPWEALRMMYDLFSQAGLVCHIKDALSSYICQTVEKILKEEGSSLAEFKAHVGKICCTYFAEDPLLEMTFHKFFEGLGVYVSPGSSPFRDPSADEMYRSPHWLF